MSKCVHVENALICRKDQLEPMFMLQDTGYFYQYLNIPFNVLISYYFL